MNTEGHTKDAVPPLDITHEHAINKLFYLDYFARVATNIPFEILRKISQHRTHCLMSL